MVAYDKFKEQIDLINSQADAAISSLTFYDPEPRKPSDSRALAQVKEEEPASDTSSEPGGLDSSDSDEDRVARPIPNKRKGGSQEEKKTDIVKTLMGMSSQMRTFTRDVEKRLDNVYKQGAGKKYGYEGITQQSIAPATLAGNAESKFEDRMLNKMQNQAQQYLESNSKKSAGPLMIKADHSLAKPLRVKHMSSSSKRAIRGK